MPLSKLIASAGYHLEAHVNKAAVFHGRLLMVSCAAPERMISGLSAALNGKSQDAPHEYILWESGSERPVKVGPCPFGYNVYKAHLAFDSYQLLAVTKDPSFMPVLNDDAMVSQLRSERFTTPFLPEWASELAAVFKDKRVLSPCNCLGCESWVLHATTKEFDAAVYWLVRSKRVAFPGTVQEEVAA